MGLLDAYNYYISECGDSITRGWLLVDSPVPLIFLSILYLYFVLSWGPNYMKNQPAYSFKTFVKFYNVFQVVTNAMLVYSTFRHGWLDNIGFVCKGPPEYYTVQPIATKMAAITWWTMLLKMLDYVETIIFVLRKKDRQISFLHLYHHISTAAISWVVIKYYPTGMPMFFIVLNCSVHVIMYSYYFLSSYGPSIQRYTNPVKPLITIVQMVQFWILIVYSIQGYLPYCSGWKTVGSIMLFDLFMNFALFYNFYQTSYKKQAKKK